jgi:hypothetical protein
MIILLFASFCDLCGSKEFYRKEHKGSTKFTKEGNARPYLCSLWLKKDFTATIDRRKRAETQTTRNAKRKDNFSPFIAYTLIPTILLFTRQTVDPNILLPAQLSNDMLRNPAVKHCGRFIILRRQDLPFPCQ